MFGVDGTGLLQVPSLPRALTCLGVVPDSRRQDPLVSSVREEGQGTDGNVVAGGGTSVTTSPDGDGSLPGTSPVDPTLV